jgi:hypothetical protein
MNPVAKQLWLAELRNPENKQIRNQLRKIVDGKPCYCAMGLLIKAYENGTGKKVRAENIYMQGNYLLNDSKESSILDWAGLSDISIVFGPSIDVDGAIAMVADLNDTGSDFAKLADAIEAQL